ncbi:MAG: tRNA threonylcarbamoyladenosine dehydratase [Deltaproteobacteria bacterium]|nr:tRNA threonylcarbamoyladenosine dehydratase [Deltaproteobacteria bacterium]
MERFSRIQSFLGEERFQILQQSFITIVGVGAVGGHVTEGLARAGIGRLRLVDFDTIQPSDINRQIMALDTTLGRPKVEVARERIAAINPRCQVEALQLFAGDETLDQILTPAPDILIDAIDSMNPKVQLLTAAHTRRIPTISSMGAALRSDPTQIRLADLMDTKNCPLAKRLRQRLRRAGIERGISCVFSTEAVTYHYQEPEELPPDTDTPFGDRGRQRRSLGSLPTLTGIFGLIIANAVILRLTDQHL